MGCGKENGRASRDAHLSDHETVAKMGHPDLWWIGGRVLVDGGVPRASGGTGGGGNDY